MENELLLKFSGDWRRFEGKLLSEIREWPVDCLEILHINEICKLMERQGFDVDDYRMDELPIAGVYYVELAVAKKGVNYFCIMSNEDLITVTPVAAVNNCNEECSTISESIKSHELEESR